LSVQGRLLGHAHHAEAGGSWAIVAVGRRARSVEIQLHERVGIVRPKKDDHNDNDDDQDDDDDDDDDDDAVDDDDDNDDDDEVDDDDCDDNDYGLQSTC
jgi:hypothetical protein